MRERIKQIIEREGMSQSQFADFIGVNRPTLSHILAGRNNPSIEVMMKIHQKFPRINIVWLFDGLGSYHGDAVAEYPMGATLEERKTENVEVSDPASIHMVGSVQGMDEASEGNIPNMMSDTENTRFYQGELFAENPIFSSKGTSGSKNRKEKPLQPPINAPYFSDSQIEYAKKSLQRKIIEIKVFYNDGTYETFKHE